MHTRTSTWVSSWTASPQPTWEAEFEFPNAVKAETIRQIVRISLGGSRVRIVFSNAYGDRPLRIGAASVALAATGSAMFSATTCKLTFGGEDGIIVPPGAPAASVDQSLDQARLGFRRRGRFRRRVA